MPIDLNQNCDAESIKQQLTEKFELVMDKGIFMVLREAQSGQELDSHEDVKIAIESGEGIIVQFIESNEEIKESDLNAIINKNVEDIWDQYDKDGNGYLDKNEAKLLVLDSLKLMGENTQIDQKEFDEVFKMFDKDGNGTIDKGEMASFIRKVAGLESQKEVGDVHENLRQNGAIKEIDEKQESDYSDDKFE